MSESPSSVTFLVQSARPSVPSDVSNYKLVMTDPIKHKIGLGIASCGFFLSEVLCMPSPRLDRVSRYCRLEIVRRAILPFKSLLIVMRLRMPSLMQESLVQNLNHTLFYTYGDLLGKFFRMMPHVALCLVEFDICMENVSALGIVASISSVFLNPGVGTRK